MCCHLQGHGLDVDAIRGRVYWAGRRMEWKEFCSAQVEGLDIPFRCHRTG